MNKVNLILVTISVYLSFESYSHAMSLGNTQEMIREISGALKNSKNLELKKEAEKTELMAREEECPPVDGSTGRPKSPIDNTQDQPNKEKAFFGLQFLAISKDGKPSMQETSIPFLNLRDELGILSQESGKERAHILAMSDEEIKKTLMGRPYSDLTGKAKEDAIDNALLLKKISGMEEGQMYAVLKQEMGRENFGRKVNLLANFLSYLSNNYSLADMTDEKPVSDKDLLNALNESIRTGNQVPAGVCRHMHQLAVKFARAMGINEAFGVGFKEPEGGHRTLVLTTPDDPTKVVQLNYGNQTEFKGVSGPSALSQNGVRPDTGIKFRIFNGHNERAINLPSELGGILNRVTGGSDSDLSPNFKSEAQIKQVGIETPYGTVRLFEASTPMGNNSSVIGGAYNLKVKYNDVFYGTVGMAGFSSQRSVSAGTLKTNGVYAQTTQGANIKIYASDDLDLSTFAEINARTTLYCSGVGEADCLMENENQFDIESGILARYYTGSFVQSTSFIFQTQFDEAKALSNEAYDFKIPVVKLSHDVDFLAASNVKGNVGGAVTMYNLGTGTYYTYEGHAGISSPKTGTTVKLNAEGRLTNNTPFWLPAAEHQTTSIIQQSIFGEKLYIGAEGRQSLEIRDNRYLGLTLGGKF